MTVPTAPAHLSARARRYWRVVLGEWELEAHQVELLRRLCEAMDTADQARVILAADGLIERDRFGQARAHPAVAIERDARLAIARLTRELNLAEAGEEARPPRTRGRH